MGNPKVFQLSRRALLGAGLFAGTSFVLKACSRGSSSSSTASDEGTVPSSGAPKEIVVGGLRG